MDQGPLPLFPEAERITLPKPSAHDARAIERDDFPFEYFSDIAEAESWRKEIHRPIYHIHKWWAQRLGSVFRAIVLATFAPGGADLRHLFYSPIDLGDVVVLDPFMGSGTTIGETLKAGGRAVGFDINPVAHFLVRNAIALPGRDRLLATFRAIEQDVAVEIHRFYEARLPGNRAASVLYYFWVKQLACPQCASLVDLFPSYVFAQHAYPRRNPDAQVLCPSCGALTCARYDAREASCGRCRRSFDPHAAPARGTKATCPGCHCSFPIAKVARGRGTPPAHRLYAKLVLTKDGRKLYLPADDFDRALYRVAERKLAARSNAYPVVKLEPGYNTNQVLNYAYAHWHEMFNARQLLCLSILADRIRAIPDEREREVFSCLFSGTLEFNNMFASFKGEGTGAVRHMFYHHILKPERTPLEANVWGTAKSSGAFSTLFRSRILRALEYAENPFELRIGKPASTKVYGLSRSLVHDPARTFAEFEQGKAVYLACRDSATTDLRQESVDAIITDPPFFDNVHYSQLADFFYAWQRHILSPHGARPNDTTRAPEAEVQQADPDLFAERLGGVWAECHRVLKPQGILAFTYHHSRAEGWRCVLASLINAGFAITQAHPIKAEMSVATPKHQAREPIDLDMILVCRKRSSLASAAFDEAGDNLIRRASSEAERQLERLLAVARRVSRNDVRVVFMAHAIAGLSRVAPDHALRSFDVVESSAEVLIDRLWRGLNYDARSKPHARRSTTVVVRAEST